MINCVVIDDQQESIDVIVDHLTKRPELSLLKTFINPLDAMIFLEKNKTDLIFIDVQMPHLNGLEFIENLREKKGSETPKFVLITGYSKYALPGFEHGVIDYLLKPIGFKRFNTAIDRLINNWKGTAINNENQFFFADIDGLKVKVNFKDVAYIESAGNYVIIAGHNLKTIIYKSMTSMEAILASEDFIRVHKSYIISISHIKAIKKNELIININDKVKEVPIGGKYREFVLKKLKINF